jgi:hypothetical protein
MVETDTNDDSNIEAEVEKVKISLGIDKLNSDMEDFEIKAVAGEFGKRGSDTTYDKNGEMVFGPEGISTMLAVVLYCYPKYYSKFNLSQPQ